NLNHIFSNELDYQLEKPLKKKIHTIFPLRSADKHLENQKDWQDLFQFSVQNNQRDAELRWEFYIKNLKTNSAWPFTDFQVLDNENKVFSEAKINYDSSKKIMEIRFRPEVKNAPRAFRLQAKTFNYLDSEVSQNWRLINFFAWDIENQEMLKNTKGGKLNLNIHLPVNQENPKLCKVRNTKISKDKIEEEWLNCSSARKRPQR
ncbi:MAG TPA: hypothetical protein PLQ36_01420, partial [Candidatus Gracilibacteria bacterium]|nr:hypothetical protein [Candidatus Gracilibacteria bacterium]